MHRQLLREHFNVSNCAPICLPWPEDLARSWLAHDGRLVRASCRTCRLSGRPSGCPGTWQTAGEVQRAGWHDRADIRAVGYSQELGVRAVVVEGRTQLRILVLGTGGADPHLSISNSTIEVSHYSGVPGLIESHFGNTSC